MFGNIFEFKFDAVLDLLHAGVIYPKHLWRDFSFGASKYEAVEGEEMGI